MININKYTPLYNLFKDNDLKIAELIQQRRYQILVHSYIYYNLDDNIIEDYQWNLWANELVELQNNYPNISKKVIYYDIFKNFTGCSGAFLKFNDQIINIANRLLEKRR